MSLVAIVASLPLLYSESVCAHHEPQLGARRYLPNHSLRWPRCITSFPTSVRSSYGTILRGSLGSGLIFGMSRQRSAPPAR